MNLSFISPVNNVCKRLFSRTRKVWRENRKKMMPAHMELMMMLKSNRDLWNAHTIYKIRHNPRSRVQLPVPPPVIVPNADNPQIAQEQGMIVIPNNVLSDFQDLLDATEMGDYRNVFLRDSIDDLIWDEDIGESDDSDDEI